MQVSDNRLLKGGNHQEEVARQIQIYVAYHAYLQGNINAFDRAFAASQANMANVDLGHYVAWMNGSHVGATRASRESVAAERLIVESQNTIVQPGLRVAEYTRERENQHDCTRWVPRDSEISVGCPAARS